MPHRLTHNRPTAHPRRIRWRSRGNPARPYICRLISLVLVLTPFDGAVAVGLG
jgi:hypothetical protein